MALTIDSKLGDIANDPKSKAILDKHCVGLTTSSSFNMIKGMTLKAVANISKGKITEEMIKGVEEDLKKL